MTSAHEMTRSFVFLVNPASGGGAAPQAVVPVARLLRDAGARVEVTYSPGPHAMRDLMDGAMSRGDVVVFVGGDGMVSSLAGPVSRGGGTLAVLPAGRGNDFARMLGLPDDPAGQAELLLTGRVRRVDLLSLTLPGAAPRSVAGSVYAGVDAHAAEVVDRTRLPKSLQYPYAAARSLATYQPGRYRLSVDGVEGEYAAACVVVANSAYYGKGMKIAPEAVIDDGVLDVVVIEAASRLELLRALSTVYDGGHVTRPEVTVLRGGKRVELHGDARRPIPLGGDGEPLGALPGLDAEPAVVEIQPGALSILAAT